MTVTVSLLVFLTAAVVVATEQYTSSSSKSQNYYTHSGVHFLKHYAEKYDLLSKFLESNNTQLIYQNTSLSSDIRSSYKVRNYNTYPHWEIIAVADRNPFSDDANVSTGYYPMEKSKEFVPQELRPAAYYFNNQFRYGPKPMDRFIAIVFKNDPWLDEDAYVSFISTTQHYDLSGKMSTVYCSFTYPIQSRSSFQNAHGRAFVQRCKIPSELSKNLTQQHHYVGLDLVYDGGVLLKNIKVKRLNYLDRRHFNTSAYIWTYNLHDVMLVEWITYNLMLGVEHFYIFDHRRLYPPLNGSTAVNKSYNGAAHFELENSQLIPFLDANIVTLIHYSFSPSIDNPSVYALQAVSFFYVLEQFGKYNKYITFCDYDEFFLPSANYHKLLHARDRPSTYFTDILNIFDDENSTQRWPGHPRPPISTLAFNSMDMGCSEAEEIDVHEVGNYVPIRKRSSTAKTAATTHCTVEGVLFHQFGLINGTFVDSDPFPYQGQGKVIIKPASELENPHCHMSGEPWLGTEFNGGIFCHYTNLRLSMMAAGGLDRKLFKSVLSPAANITCRDFALKMVNLYAEVIEK
jgi:hypothetical protein